MPIETAAVEAPNPRVSETQDTSPKQGGAFDLMLSQLMQAIISLPVQPQLPGADESLPTGEDMAAEPPIDGAAGKMASMPLLSTLQTVQAAFSTTIANVLDGIAAQEKVLPAFDQTVLAEDSLAAELPIDGAAGKIGTVPLPETLQAVQSAFVAAIAEVLDGVAEQEKTLRSSAISQEQTALQKTLSLMSGKADAAAAEEDIKPELLVRPDSSELKISSQKTAEPVQNFSEAMKKTPALELQHPLIMREIMLAEGASKDMADLPDTQERLEKAALPDVLPGTSTGPQVLTRMHTQAAEVPTAVVRPQQFSEAMHMEGNRFMITRLDGTSIEISLQPEGMGKLDIGLLLDKGVVNAQIQASSTAAKELIEKHMHDIMNALAQDGITIGGFSVSLKDDRSDFSSSHGKGQEHQIQEESVNSSEYISAPRQLIDRGAVSIFV